MGFLSTMGKNSKESSKNIAYPYLKDAYSGAVSTGTGAMDYISSLLGMGDPAKGQQALSQWQNSTGYQNTLDAGTRAITNNGAARGLLRSGATGKAITNFGQQAATSSFNSLIQSLLGLSGQGLNAGQIIGGAGNTQTAKANDGWGGAVGGALSLISDPRAKTDVVQIGTADNGLGVYNFRYIWDDEDVVRTGYMADEVAVIAPHALGPVVDGYQSVDYSRLPEIE